MYLEIVFSQKLKYYLTLLFFQFCLLVTSSLKERLQNTFAVFGKSEIEHNLRAKVWLYSFESVLCQVLTDFFFVVYLLFFLKPHKKLNTDNSTSFSKNIGNRTPMGCFS